MVLHVRKSAFATGGAAVPPASDARADHNDDIQEQLKAMQSFFKSEMTQIKQDLDSTRSKVAQLEHENKLLREQIAKLEEGGTGAGRRAKLTKSTSFTGGRTKTRRSLSPTPPPRLGNLPETAEVAPRQPPLRAAAAATTPESFLAQSIYRPVPDKITLCLHESEPTCCNFDDSASSLQLDDLMMFDEVSFPNDSMLDSNQWSSSSVADKEKTSRRAGLVRSTSEPVLIGKQIDVAAKEVLGPLSAEAVFKYQSRDTALKQYLAETPGKRTALCEKVVDGKHITFFKGKLYVPAQLRFKVMKFYFKRHGMANGKDYLCNNCIWPGLTKDVQKYKKWIQLSRSDVV